MAPLGCTRNQEADNPTPTTLVFELPAGIEVGVDGEPPSKPPTQPVVVEPGSRSITLRSKCQTLTGSVDASAHEATRVTAASLDGFRVATLGFRVSDLEGSPLRHTVTTDDVEIATGEGSSQVQVPGCTYRVRVSSDGLGGFMEDIDFGAVADVQRDVVLSPGPDMVRLQGGKFVLGPPEHLRDKWVNEMDELIISRIPVELEPFDIDRTEVTAAQWMKCRAAGGCPIRRELFGLTQLPRGYDRPHCNVDTSGARPSPTPGREEHPVNCVARWEAEDYCLWAGKRLPTPVEWEYAARSGDSSYTWPWGNDEPTCAHANTAEQRKNCGKSPGTTPVCSFPAGSSKQGVCDVTGNVMEYVEGANGQKTPENPRGRNCVDEGWQGYANEPLRHSVCLNKPSQESRVGFRCARSHPSKGV